MTSTQSKSYFDLHITGIGYLNRIRMVTPKKGEAFLACDIAALNGPSDAPEYRRFDVRVSGSEAQNLIQRCEKVVSEEHKVLLGFRLGDLWADTFTYTKGKNAGQPGVSLKARLLYVSWIKIDGELVYKAVKTPEDNRHETPAETNAVSSVEQPSEASSAPAQDNLPARTDSF